MATPIEKAAKAAFVRFQLQQGGMVKWEELAESAQDFWRVLARDTVEAFERAKGESADSG